MNRNLRTVRDLIERGGGREIAMGEGGKHAVVEFTNPADERRSVTFHRGTNPKRFEDCLRSQLRRAGLRL